jgi:hypothetical protein
MFEVIIMICASSFALEVDFDNCIYIKDAWGPYKTEHYCEIRSDQLSEELLVGELNRHFTVMLDYPEMLSAMGHCRKVDGDEMT